MSDASLSNTCLCINIHKLTHKHSKSSSCIQTLTCIQNTFKHLTTLRHLKWPSTPTRALCINSTPRPLSSSFAGFLSVAVPLPEGGSQLCPSPFLCYGSHHSPFLTNPHHSSFLAISIKDWFIGPCLVCYSATMKMLLCDQKTKRKKQNNHRLL